MLDNDKSDRGHPIAPRETDRYVAKMGIFRKRNSNRASKRHPTLLSLAGRAN
jgi:hypothetical protein